MERDSEFIVGLDDGQYAVRPFEGDVVVEHGAHAVTGRWEHFGLTAAGDHEGEVYRDLFYALKQQSGFDPGAPDFRPLARYVRARGRRLSDEEIQLREESLVRGIVDRRIVEGDVQYEVSMFADARIERWSDGVAMSALGCSGSGVTLPEAFQRLKLGIEDAYGGPNAPGPRYGEISSWVRSHGEPVTAEVLTREAEESAARAIAHEQITNIGLEDIAAHGTSDLPVLLYLWAKWCGFCGPLAPVLTDLADRLAGRLIVAKLEVELGDEVFERFDLPGIPALLLFEGGRELHRVVGMRSVHTLLLDLEPHLRRRPGGHPRRPGTGNR